MLLRQKRDYEKRTQELGTIGLRTLQRLFPRAFKRMLSVSFAVVVPFIFRQITCVMRQIELWEATPGCKEVPRIYVHI